MRKNQPKLELIHKTSPNLKWREKGREVGREELDTYDSKSENIDKMDLYSHLYISFCNNTFLFF